MEDTSTKVLFDGLTVVGWDGLREVVAADLRKICPKLSFGHDHACHMDINDPDAARRYLAKKGPFDVLAVYDEVDRTVDDRMKRASFFATMLRVEGANTLVWIDRRVDYLHPIFANAGLTVFNGSVAEAIYRRWADSYTNSMVPA